MRVTVWMASLMAVVALAANVEAQPGGGGGRGGGRGFGGGRGMGGVMMLVGNEAVQKDLALGTDEAAKVKVVTDEFGTAMRETFTGMGNFQDMSEEERTKAREKMTEPMKTVNEKYLPKVKELLTADQYTRLQQINWQNMGAMAYSDAEVVKALDIKKEQTEKITQLTDEYGAKTRELFTPGQPPDFAKMGEINKERDAKIDEVLTKEQNDKFTKLKGKEFDVTQLRRGPGGPGGGGGGGGAGGRPKRPQPKAE